MSAVDDVANGVDGGRVELDAEVDEHRHEALWAPCLQGFLGLPDVEHLDFAGLVESDVVDSSGRRAVTGASSRRIASSYFSGVKPACLK
jgi:hypothetical protein